MTSVIGGLFYYLLDFCNENIEYVIFIYDEIKKLFNWIIKNFISHMIIRNVCGCSPRLTSFIEFKGLLIEGTQTYPHAEESLVDKKEGAIGAWSLIFF